MRRIGAIWLALYFFTTPLSVVAQEVKWRHDYNVARQEAQQKDLPLVIDFGTDNCFWCKKLDASTFRDATVVGVMNERFIPLKIDAQKNPALTEALRIQSFPTIVLATPDGKILGTLEGFMAADKFHEHLQRALASSNNPEWMNRDYQEAGKAIANSDFGRAIALLKNIIDDKKERPIQVKARTLLSDLEKQAAGLLARAKQLEDRGQTSEALSQLTELLKSFAGTQAAADAGQRLLTLTPKPEIKVQQRTVRARELWAQAREDFRTQQYLWCLDRCEILISSFGDLPEGAEAHQLAAEIKNNPDWMKQACENLGERLGSMYLALAETWLKKGQPQQAEIFLERAIQAFPGTRQADAAQTRLNQIRGQPTRPAGFKKP